MTASDHDDSAAQMTDEELDRLLDSAHATLARRVERSTDVNVLLTNLLDMRPERPTPELTPFMAHVRLRQTIADVYRATVLANSLVQVTPASERLDGVLRAVEAAFTKACADNLHEVEALVQLLNVAMARALKAAMAPTATDDLLLEAYLSTLTGSLVSTLGRSLARASDLAMDLPRFSAETYKSAARDLCGADLSGHDLGSIQMLHDFTWDSRTIWPAALETEAKKHSDLVGEGLYRIRRKTPPCHRDSAMATP
ncbi:hypothetical protein ACU635_20915 [[Actinomadura] parvosata]|uniref:hypothetical protein n=1 Tax=[Actinomadura] parvosata TaxID=1955412 RepID=UPI00406D38CB